jgi:simple sugar transport system ATP-binding protein
VRQAKSRGVAVVLITHNIAHAYEVCDRFAVVFHGRMAEIASKDGVTADQLANLINTGSRNISKIAV